MTGGLGVIPEPTVKVRMRENQRVAVAPFVQLTLLKGLMRRLPLPFHPEMQHQISIKGVEDEPSVKF
ncbi:hypothetical protein MCEORE3_01039 [Candidatus Nanopelagicaceae bacterium]